MKNNSRFFDGMTPEETMFLRRLRNRIRVGLEPNYTFERGPDDKLDKVIIKERMRYKHTFKMISTMVAAKNALIMDRS